MTQNAQPQRTFDIFPANVTVTATNFAESKPINDVHPVKEHNIQGAKYVHTARVVASRGMLYIAVDSSTGPVLFFKEEIKSQTAEDKTTRFVTTSDRVIAVKKDKSCGCGSRLKNWSPVGSVLGSSKG